MDLTRLKRGAQADVMKPSTGERVPDSQTPSGSDMATALWDFIADPTPTHYDKVCVPLSMDVGPPTETGVGCGKVQPETCIPPELEHFTSTDERWKVALNPAPSYTALHHDYLLSGQFMIHLFGKKVRVSLFSTAALSSNLSRSGLSAHRQKTHGPWFL